LGTSTAAFHNGDVKKMWSWWAQKDQTRSGTVPGYIGEPAVGATQHATIDGTANRESLAASMSSHPRTMKELSSMTSAARASQWGEPGESETSSAGFPVLGTNFFDDDSDSTSESGVGHDDEVADPSSSARDQKQMYDSYFRGYQRPLVEQAAPDPDEPLEGGRESDFRLVAVPSSGMLSPIVNVSHEFDRISLQNQSRELAQSWKLGDFKVTSGVGNTVSHDPSRRARFDPYDSDPLVSQSSLSKRGKSMTRVDA
jgi:hypothetical protein